jgi:hypothetical protein
VGVTFCLTLIAWIFFRAANITTAFTMLRQLFSASLFTSPGAALRDFGILSTAIYAGLGVCFLLGLEWFQRGKRYALEFETQPVLVRWPAYASVAALVLVLRYTGESLDFIYFQF